jgi:hypothetical protein
MTTASNKHELTDEPLAAAEFYERLISQDTASHDDYVNLCAIYVSCQDPGYACGKSLTREFCGRAIDRVDEIAGSFSEFVPEIEFWKGYLAAR